MSDSLVSIVIPVYNQEKYLNISVPCVLNQDYKNIEIILVNDGSTDSSKTIIQKFAAEDSRIKFIDKNNGGLVDATIAGVSVSSGEYIAFLDPDDRIGSDFIENFIKELQSEYDFIAEGFYYDNNGSITPYFLTETRIYEKETLEELRDNFLYSKKTGGISNDIFFSRWNKLYRMELLKKVIEEFKNYKGITLGEDTIFTYLMLMYAKKGKAIEGVNSYYYNIGNQDSMMKSKNIKQHFQKAHNAYEIYLNLLKKDYNNQESAFALYYFLIESLFNNIDADSQEYKEILRYCCSDELYKRSLEFIGKHTSNRRQKINVYLRKYCWHPVIYIFLTNKLIMRLKKARNTIRNGKLFLENSIKFDLKKSFYIRQFQAQRESALDDLYREIPILEERITDIINQFSSQSKDLDSESIEKNIFVFWWDGFENAPIIVQNCLKSLKKCYQDFTIALISKSNYEEYTNIDPIIRSDFNAGKISVQTFSDILRFNLLRTNGGMWVDATIHFTQKYDLLEKLDKQSFNSISFGSSNSFFQYKGNKCSWTGFFIASRKNGCFVRTMDYIFREYYKKYRTYSIYFFIDAAFMVCKITHVDNNVIDKVNESDGDMFLLSKIINSKYEESCMKEVTKLPQKLAWNIRIESNKNVQTFYQTVIGK